MNFNVLNNKERLRVLSISGKFGWCRRSLALFVLAPRAWYVSLRVAIMFVWLMDLVFKPIDSSLSIVSTDLLL